MWSGHFIGFDMHSPENLFMYLFVRERLILRNLTCCFLFFKGLLFFISSWKTGTSRVVPSSQDWGHEMERIHGFFSVICSVQFSSVQLLSHVRLFATPWIAACQASLSITNSRSSLRLTSIESVMPSSHLILCHPLFLLPPIPPSIRVYSNESTLGMRWPKDWSFSFSIIPSKEHPGLISFRMD